MCPCSELLVRTGLHTNSSSLVPSAFLRKHALVLGCNKCHVFILFPKLASLLIKILPVFYLEGFYGCFLFFPNIACAPHLPVDDDLSKKSCLKFGISECRAKCTSRLRGTLRLDGTVLCQQQSGAGGSPWPGPKALCLPSGSLPVRLRTALADVWGRGEKLGVPCVSSVTKLPAESGFHTEKQLRRCGCAQSFFSGWR